MVFFDIISGNLNIKVIRAKDGYIHDILHVDESFNITNALATEKKIEDPEEEFHLRLKKIELENIDVYKLNESNGMKIASYIDDAQISLEKSNEHVFASVDTDFRLNVISNEDTAWFKNKHVHGHLEIDCDKTKDFLVLYPSEIFVEEATFNGEGSIDI
ncbi:MAG: hypothetical protein MK105_19695 [Crocinitomicaceae bacterium]|nr:hypothetical protein [Crocinitomicaceae bacterium]